MKKTILIVLIAAMALGGILCLWLLPREKAAPATLSQEYVPVHSAETEIESSTPYPTAPPVPIESTSTPAPIEVASSPVPTTEPYVSPVNFEALSEINSDIYAWLEISGTDISLPILQHPVDDAYYLNHDADGKASPNGAVFSESYYNAKDFVTDPVVLLYGHHMPNGAIFGNLQKYFTDAGYLSSHEPIIVYTPEAEYKYQVFAAVPYSNKHILFFHDMTDDNVFTSFFDQVMSITDREASFFPEYAPQPGDHVLILSTCLASNNQKRFLVLATMQ